VDETNRRWVSEYRTKSYASPLKLESVDPSKYAALLIPSSPGAVYDLVKHDSMMHILRAFARDKSKVVLNFMKKIAFSDCLAQWFSTFSCSDPILQSNLT